MALFSDFLSMPKISKFLEEMKSSTNLVFLLSTKRGRETKRTLALRLTPNRKSALIPRSNLPSVT